MDVAPLVPLFWHSVDICPRFQSQGRSLALVRNSLSSKQFLLARSESSRWTMIYAHELKD